MGVRFLGIILLFGASCFSQTKPSSFWESADSLNKPRFWSTTAGISSIWAGSNLLLSQIWYKEFERTSWHTFDDSKSWMQVDKVGHAYTAYQLSSLVAKTYRWSGVKHRTAAWIGAGVGWSYQFSVEMLDAYSSNWGFSWSDVAANTLGSSLFLGQELFFRDQFLKFKFSYRESGLASYRPSHLGSTLPEKILKDYNAQNYWLSFSPFYFSKNPKAPKWLAIAIGYGAHQKFIGDSDVFTSSDGRTFEAKREWLLSLDVDVKQLPIRNRWLKAALSPFNTIKFPFPTLMWRGKTFYALRSY
ncbi:MAG: DUF2279 domain-containing protein [Bacteroidetes bacterium]|nr:MAG: DUF2279 domain-containing protein [Bacteroidota bacterium]